MLRTLSVVLGILLIFGCADVSQESQLQTGCSGGSESTPENVYVSPSPTSPTPSDTTAPTVAATTPFNGATNFSVSGDVIITFSESMDSSTINTSNITLTDSSGNSVSGTVSYSNSIVTLNPSGNLGVSTTYTITVRTGVKDSAGNPLASNFSTSFSTSSALDTTAPTISSTSPSSGATGASVSSDITITFSESMDFSTISTSNITLADSGGNSVSGVVSYNNNVATFNPSSDLGSNTTYTVTVGTGVKDSAGNALASSSNWSFTTSSAVSGWSGTKQLVSTSADFSQGITTDPSGNVYVTGMTTGGLDGNSNAGGNDLFVVKYNSSGIKQWTQQLGTSAYDRGCGIISDSSGNVYVTGYTKGDGLDGNISAGSSDLFVVKYNSSGIKQWTKQLGSSHIDYGQGITSDSSGNIYVTGYTYGSLDGNTSAGSSDLFVVKYNSSGIKQWTKQLGSSGNDFGYSIISDPSGSLYVTGETYGGLDGNNNSGSHDLFVVKYNSSGVKKWTQQLGTSAIDRGNGITSDSSGNVYVTGYTQGGLDGNTNAGWSDLFVVKYNSSGVKKWTQQLGTSSSEEGTGITSDSSGNVYVTGYTQGSLDGNTNAGNDDLFVVKYNSSGVKQWTKQLGTSAYDGGFGITSDSSGNVYVAAHSGGGLDGNTNTGSIFVVKYDTDGNKQ